MRPQENATFRNTVILIVGLFLVWELAYLVVGDVALRSPWQTVKFLGKLMRTDLFWLHLTDSLKAFAVALAIAVVLGLLIGFALGLHRLSGEAMEPMLVALYSIPKITLYPIILLAFGIGISAKIAFGGLKIPGIALCDAALIVRGRVRGAQCDRPIERADRRGRVVHFSQANTQVVPGIGKIGRQRRAAFVSGPRRRALILLEQDVAEVEPGVGVVRRHRERAPD